MSTFLPSIHVRLDAQAVIDTLKRLQAIEILSARVLGGWLPGVARWEAKHQLGVHLWEDAEHSRALRTRLWELRVANADRDVGDGPARLIHGLSLALEDYEFLGGLYLVLKPALASAYARLLEQTNAILDAPTRTILRHLLPEKEAQVAWAREAVPLLAQSEEARARLERWTGHATRLLAAAGGVLGHEPVPAGLDATPPPGYGVTRLPFGRAHRDERFQLSLAGIPLPPEDDDAGQVRFQFFNYTQEMQAVETLGSLLWEAEGMEWEFYHDVARHCYDEERHSAMGEMRLRDLGYAVTDFPHTVANYAWRQLVDPLRRYCVLTYVIEADSFKYKHATYRRHLARGDLHSAEAVLWDIMDETLHVRFGQQWVPALMKQYRYTGTLEALVAECREILVANTVNPLQRRCAEVSATA